MNKHSTIQCVNLRRICLGLKKINWLNRSKVNSNSVKEALTCFDYAVLIDESFIGAYLEKAKTYEQLDEYEDAIKNYMITLELDDPTAFAYARVGECYHELGKLDMAISFYKKAVHEEPLLDKGSILLTDAYYAQEDYQKVVTIL